MKVIMKTEEQLIKEFGFKKCVCGLTTLYNGFTWNITRPMIDMLGKEITVYKRENYNNGIYSHICKNNYLWSEKWFDNEVWDSMNTTEKGDDGFTTTIFSISRERYLLIMRFLNLALREYKEREEIIKSTLKFGKNYKIESIEVGYILDNSISKIIENW